jgi:AcrR family transcriptional regulator
MSPTSRKDALRNRGQLIAAATRAFASGDGRVVLESIAKDAGVGVGTLYRHFPTREALVEAVYHDQVARLRDGAEMLLADNRPAVALRRWMDLFAEWAVAKHGMVDTLGAVIASGNLEMGEMRAELVAVVRLFLDTGAAVGDLRSDVDAADIAASLAGVMVVAGAPEQREQAARMLDLLMAGLEPRRPPCTPDSAP